MDIELDTFLLAEIAFIFVEILKSIQIFQNSRQHYQNVSHRKLSKRTS